jgi:uncharacterized SAM-binding protein YcdF (DUF218 family)
MIGTAWQRRSLAAGLLLIPPTLVLVGFGFFALTALDPPRPAEGRTDAIVVLTGGSERIATGLGLLAEGRAERLLISGAHPGAGLAEIAAAVRLDPAAFARRVDVGHAAASTRGNAVETAAWARATGARSIRVVTAGYHMPRAMLELRRAMPQHDLVPHAVPSAALRGPHALWRPRVWVLLGGEYLRVLAAHAGLSAVFGPRREMGET